MTRRIISGIVRVLKSGCRWKDCPAEYGPPTTVYNRFTQWAERGVWEGLFQAFAQRCRSTATCRPVIRTGTPVRPQSKLSSQDFLDLVAAKVRGLAQHHHRPQLGRREGAHRLLGAVHLPLRRSAHGLDRTACNGCSPTH